MACLVTERKHSCKRFGVTRISAHRAHSFIWRRQQTLWTDRWWLRPFRTYSPRASFIFWGIPEPPSFDGRCLGMRTGQNQWYNTSMIFRVVALLLFISSTMTFSSKLVSYTSFVDNEPSLRLHAAARTSFVDCSKIVDSCVWHFTSRGDVIRVCVPPILLLRRWLQSSMEMLKRCWTQRCRSYINLSAVYIYIYIYIYICISIYEITIDLLIGWYGFALVFVIVIMLVLDLEVDFLICVTMIQRSALSGIGVKTSFQDCRTMETNYCFLNSWVYEWFINGYHNRIINCL